MSDIQKITGSIALGKSAVVYATTPISFPDDFKSTNITGNFGGNTGFFAANLAKNAAASLLGYPQVFDISANKTDTGAYETIYATTPFDRLNAIPGLRYQDFRSRIPYSSLRAKRFDGARLATATGDNRSWIGRIYAAASAAPGGAYSIFNIGGNKYFGAGIGDESNPSAITNDFTLRSHVNTSWDHGKDTWRRSKNPIDWAIPFRGDRVTVIDFGKRTEKNAYAWNPLINSILGDKLGSDVLGAGLTQDFIKFYFTGPKLHNGIQATDSKAAEDDIIVFRAIINTLTDSFSPNWTNVSLIGRADPNYQYTGYSRDLQLDFTVFATSRDELKPIWRKLNAMAGYTAPEYDAETIGLKGPWMRITIGDMFVQQPAILSSLSYTLQDSDTTWEINIEQDPTLMQVPHKISVSCGFNLITDYLPQKGGRFYTLAKKWDGNGTSQKGDDNWLSDFKENVDREIRPDTLRNFKSLLKKDDVGGPDDENKDFGLAAGKGKQQ